MCLLGPLLLYPFFFLIQDEFYSGQGQEWRRVKNITIDNQRWLKSETDSHRLWFLAFAPLYFMYLNVLFQNIFVNLDTPEATNFPIRENFFSFYISDFYSTDQLIG